MDSVQVLKEYTPLVVPANCAILVNNRKHWGDAEVTDPDTSVVVDPDTREIHTWRRGGYHRWMLADGESVSKAWEQESAIRRGRKFSASRQMKPCPNELAFDGECSHRFDKKHGEWYYHFAKRTRYGEVVYVNGRPLCRYSRTDRTSLCWERHNGPHVCLFHHKH